VWHGVHYTNIGNIARFAPSACNTQPWIVEATQTGLSVYRYKKPGKRGIMPVAMVTHYNRIDIGIFLLFLELCLEHEGIGFERTLLPDTGDEEKTLIAVYQLHDPRC
ncbi:MAG: nitroreductase, partial [Oscillospiraceae bacterium]|nr:nitroreductase [Oscillospiraceae bacterium]